MAISLRSFGMRAIFSPCFRHNKAWSSVLVCIQERRSNVGKRYDSAPEY
jgi:hypothetical protein